MWPPPGQAGGVSGWTALTQFELRFPPDLSDEKLVAVAMPVGADFGPHQRFTAFCRTPEPFSGASYLEQASVVASSFKVLPFDAPRCLARGVASLGVVESDDLDVCGAVG